jgi:NADPH:quinone reductase-like Zn-dependent oxidoreductase
MIRAQFPLRGSLMKAIVLHEFGEPEVLTYEDVERPEPGPGEVLVKVHAVSVNQTLDLGIRAGTAGYNIPLPAILGIDSAGEVESVGDGGSSFAKGDRVTSILRPPVGLGYAEYVIANARATYHVPDGLGYPEAAAVSRHFPMAYSLCRAAEVQEDGWVLVMGAAGSLGAAAVQVAKHRGAHVIAAAGTDERAQTGLALGAEAWVNYRSSNLAAEVNRITGGQGANAVLENIADPDLWPGAFNSMATGGILVTVGAHGGGRVELDVRKLYRDGLTIRSGLNHREPGDGDDALALAAAGIYKTTIHTLLPLSQAAEAHRIASDRSIIGKIVMDPTLG